MSQDPRFYTDLNLLKSTQVDFESTFKSHQVACETRLDSTWNQTYLSTSETRVEFCGNITAHLLILMTTYCTISFNLARVVTCDPKYQFSTSATNKFWRDTSKNSAFKTKNFENSAFFAPPREIWPQCHFTFGTGCRDPGPTPKFIAAQRVRDE
jgi:hypothetical protein